jgi:hypothetical protein
MPPPSLIFMASGITDENPERVVKLTDFVQVKCGEFVQVKCGEIVAGVGGCFMTHGHHSVR